MGCEIYDIGKTVQSIKTIQLASKAPRRKYTRQLFQMFNQHIGSDEWHTEEELQG